MLVGGKSCLCVICIGGYEVGKDVFFVRFVVGVVDDGSRIGEGLDQIIVVFFNLEGGFEDYYGFCVVVIGGRIDLCLFS